MIEKKEAIMKRLFLIIVLPLLLCGCVIPADANVPDGYLSKTVYDDRDRWADWTDYRVYAYKDKTAFENNAKFNVIRAENGKTAELDEALKIADAFTGHMAAVGREDQLRFKPDDIGPGDLVFIAYNEPERMTMYFFDSETNTLHYMDLKA